MNKNSISYILFFISSICFSQTPGNVGNTDISMWLKADVGVLNAGISAVNGQSVSVWVDQTPSRSNDATPNNLAPPTFRNNTSDNLNYNPVIDFDGINDGLSFGNDFVFSTGTGTQNGISYFAIVKPDLPPLVKSNQFIFDFGFYADRGFGLQYGNSHYAIYTSNVGTAAAGGGGVFSGRIAHSRGLVPTLNTFKVSFTSTQSLFLDGSKIAAPSTASPVTLLALNNLQIDQNPNHIISSGPFTIGHQSKADLIGNENGRRLDGKLAEIVGYNKNLSATNTTQIESYLAVKYGITLVNTGGGINGNYLASNGTSTIWTASVSPLYQNRIIGIGRDDNTGLLQKQSHTDDDTLRIYKGNLATTNISNSSTFASNLSYVLIGSNNGKLCAGSTTSLEIPSGCSVVKRIDREWKVTKTNFAEAFNLDIKLNSCAITSSVNIADLRLLVDDDGDFSNGGTNCYYNGDGTGIVISYAAPVITFSNIVNTHLPNNATKYITIGSVNLLTPLPVELTNFSLDCDEKESAIQLSWTTLSEFNNDYFEIQKSSDAINWNVIGTVDGSGNSVSIKNYTFKDLDKNIINESGISYYRLVQVDFGLTHTIYHSIIYSDKNCQLFYPNPSFDKIFIHNHELYKTYEILNQLGQIVKADEITTNFIVINNLSEGIYHIRLFGLNEKIISKKLQISRKQ